MAHEYVNPQSLQDQGYYQAGYHATYLLRYLAYAVMSHKTFDFESLDPRRLKENAY